MKMIHSSAFICFFLLGLSSQAKVNPTTTPSARSATTNGLSAAEFTVLEATSNGQSIVRFVYQTSPIAAAASSRMALGAAQPIMSPQAMDTFVPGCVRPGSGLIDWWQGEGNASDSTGPHPGQIFNGATFVAGQVGQAFSLNGTNQSVQIPYSPGLAPAGFSIETWVKPTRQIRLQGFVFGQVYGRQLVVQSGVGGLIVSFFVTDTNGAFSGVSSSGVVPIGQWTHLAGTWDGANLKLYTNGVLARSAALQLPAIGDSGCPFSIGGINNSCGYSGQYFPGLIDEVSLYNRALFPGEINAIYLAGSAGKCKPPQPCAVCPASVVSWWPAEGNASDVLGNNPGTLQNGASFDNGTVGQAFKFNGNLQAVEVPYSNNLATTAFSVEAWVNPSSQASGQAFIFGQTYGRQLVVRPGMQGLSVAFIISRDPLTFYEVDSSGAIPIGEWTHLVGTWDGAFLSLYVNGALDQQAKMDLVPWDSRCPFHIGGVYDPSGPCAQVGQFFNGLIDEPSIYNTALSASQIRTVYDQGIAGKCMVPPQDGMVIAWGQDNYGQCDVPAGLSNVVAVAGGNGHSLALRHAGTVVAWGNNLFGQTSVPAGLSNVVGISANWDQSAAVLANGTVANWGDTNGTIPNLSNAVAISAGAEHVLALLANGTVATWGSSGPWTNVPPGLSQVRAVAAGWGHSLALLADGTVKAWGLHDYGATNVPVGLSNVIAIAAGGNHSLALRFDGTVFAWGDNTDGQTDVPASLGNVVAITAGGSFNSALKSDGSVVVWGGLEPDIPGRAPQGLDQVMGIGAGLNHELAIRPVALPPVIVQGPADVIQTNGGSVTFDVSAAGLAPITYQWQFGSVNIAGATGTALPLTGVQATNDGTYRVLVSNEAGAIVSSNASLHLVTAPAIVSMSQPTNQTIHYQSSVTLSVTATAPGDTNGFPLAYQWRLNGANIAGATSVSYSFPATVGPICTYSVTVTNVAGSANAVWQVAVLYDTLAYHLATNAVGHAAGYTNIPGAMLVVSGYTYPPTNTLWSTNCWLHGVQGLSATCIGFSNAFNGQGLVTMVSPRHFLFAAHTFPGLGGASLAFLDTNNVVYWRALAARTNLDIWHNPATNDTAIGILNADLPPSVGYVPVLSPDFATYLSTDSSIYIQGIGMNQEMRVFSQPMNLSTPYAVGWDPAQVIPFGLGTNWSRTIIKGDSSNPERFLINNQLVLISGNATSGGGPNYASEVNGINERMSWLSAAQGGSNSPDYQLTLYPLTNWPAIRNK